MEDNGAVVFDVLKPYTVRVTPGPANELSIDVDDKYGEPVLTMALVLVGGVVDVQIYR